MAAKHVPPLFLSQPVVCILMWKLIALLQLLETCKKQDKEECTAATHSALVALQSFETQARSCLQLLNIKRIFTDSGTAHTLEQDLSVAEF